MSEIDRILIAGGGPVGLTAALSLAEYGIPFTLLEAAVDIFEDPRAGTIHPPTLEMFARLGLTDTFVERGYIIRKYHYRDRRQGVVAEFDLGLLGDETPYPFRLMLEQHKISHLVAERLKGFEDAEVLHGHNVLDVSQSGDGVTARVECADGIKSFQGRYMIGCDGGSSQVRKSIDLDFEGFQWPERFLVVTTPHDFAAEGYALTNYIADPDEWCALFKLPGTDDKGIWRVLFPTDPDETEAQIFDDATIERRLQGFHPKHEPYQVHHRNHY